jgi:excisionase family DNA binding protein
MKTRTTDKALPFASGKILLSVEEAAALMSLGRSAIYGLVRRNEIVSIKVCRTRRIPLVALQKFVAQQIAVNEQGM